MAGNIQIKMVSDSSQARKDVNSLERRDKERSRAHTKMGPQSVRATKLSDAVIPLVDDEPSELPKDQSLRVFKIIDGDTIDVLTVGKKRMQLRLNDIDTPENDEPLGKNARQYLSRTQQLNI